jgi:hypothetical protein
MPGLDGRLLLPANADSAELSLARIGTLFDGFGSVRLTVFGDSTWISKHETARCNQRVVGMHVRCVEFEEQRADIKS